MGYLDKKELALAADFMAKLSKGIDPITNTILSDDTVLNNRKYIELFSYTEDVLRYLIINNIGEWTYNTKPELHLSDIEIQNIKISKEPISVSQIAYNINAVADTSHMKKIKATQITEWLTELGYLQEDIEGKTSHKVCTEKAKEIGIQTIEKVNEYDDKYYVSIYHESAQKFIIDNINEISKNY